MGFNRLTKFTKMKNVLIFGAEGLIGKEIIKSSNLKNQFNIIGLDINKKSKSKIIKANTLNYNNLKKIIIKINKKYGKIYGCKLNFSNSFTKKKSTSHKLKNFF